MSKKISIAEAFSFAWKKFKEKPKFWILVMAMIIVFTGGTTSFSNLVSSGFNKTENRITPETNLDQDMKITIDGSEYQIPSNTKVEVNQQIEKVESEINTLAWAGIIVAGLMAIFIGIAFMILYLVVTNFIYMGSIKLILDAVRGNALKYTTLLSIVSVKRSLKYWGATVLYGLMIVGGLILFIFPGVYLAVKYGLFPYAFVDKELGIMDSLKYSAKLTEGVKFKLLGFYLVCTLFMILGFMAFMIGAFFVGILVMLANAYIYDQLLKGKMGSMLEVEK